jgi:hypothetical protein
LWTLLQRSEVADLFDAGVCERLGRLISRSAFNPVNPGWYSGWAQCLAPNDAADRAQVQSPKIARTGLCRPSVADARSAVLDAAVSAAW